MISSELKGRFFLASYSIIIFFSFLLSGGTTTVFKREEVLLIVNDIGTPDLSFLIILFGILLPFFSSLVDFITSSPVVALALKGENAIQKTRTMMGVTNPLESDPGTIRGDFGLTVEKNIIHGSANEKDAKRELNLYFDKNELIDYERSIDSWTE